jgi:hypothetical protein
VSKRKDRLRTEVVFTTVQNHTQLPPTPSNSHDDGPIDEGALADMATFAPLLCGQKGKRELTKMKKFRFQLLHQWIVNNIAPCRVADVAGGKGLMAYLLQRDGWETCTIDPVNQVLPEKYKDLVADRQIKVAPTEKVRRITAEFHPEMAPEFDLFVALHAHGCNFQLIDVCAEQQKRAILLPCCVIGEPIVPAPGQHWIVCVVEYALAKGLTVEPFRLNFKGQNIGLLISP